LEKLREDYGIKENIDIAITTDQNVAVDSILGYLGTQYKLVQAIPFDSHYLLIGKKWLSKSSTLISA
jgi:hypothetical protein